MRALLLTLALLVPLACQAQPAVVGETGAALDAYLTEAGFSGAVIATVGGETVLRKGYGFADRSAGVENTPETAIQIGSVAKPFTAALVLSLVDAGRLDVSNTLADHFDGVPEAKAGITVHHLLTHTSGFPGGIGDDDEAIGREAYVARALATDLDRAPGDAYEYSNVGFALLAAIVEQTTGQSYDAALQAFLAEAGIERTGYRLDPSVPVANGHDGDRDLGPPTDQPWAEDGPHWNLRGNGGLLSTADDLLAFADALDRGALLSDAARDRMATKHTDEGEGSGSHYGYGWALFETPNGLLVTHNGGDPGSSADLLRFVDGDATLVVLSNDRAVEAYDVSGPLARILFGGEVEPFEPGGGPVEVPLDAVASRPTGQAALAFFDAYAAGTEAAARAYVAEYLDGPFQNEIDAVVGFFGAVREEVGGQALTPDRALWDDDEGRLEIRATLPDGRAYAAYFGFDDDGKIAGLSADFVPDETAAASGECPEPRLPDAPIGDRFRALLDALCDGSEPALRAFVAEHVAPETIERNGAESIVFGLLSLAEDAGGREVVGVMLRSEREGTVAVEGPGGVVRIAMALAEAPPHRIATIDVEAGEPEPEFGSLDEALGAVEAAAEAGRFSGVVLVAKDGEPVAEVAHGWADAARGEEVTPETRFNIGSITKMMTGVAILQLVERGLVDLDAPIGAYLDGFPDDVAEAVTVRHLLQHRSGWGHYWDHPTFEANEAAMTEIGDFVDMIRAIPLDFAPGSRERYSNAGYEVLGGIIEAASGQRFYDYMAEHVWGPAGMTDAGEATHGVPGHATPYLGDGYDRPSPIAKIGTAAGGTYATARDLLRFQTALEDGTLLSDAMRNLLVNRFESTDPVEPSIGIGGGAPGINAVWEWDAPSGWSVVVVANREPPAAEELGIAVLRAARAE